MPNPTTPPPSPPLSRNSKRSLDSASFNSNPSKSLKSLSISDKQHQNQQQKGGEVQIEEKKEEEEEKQRRGMQRYLVAVEYIGTRFSGSQKQSNCRTVVGALEDAFDKFIGQPVLIGLSSRTDSGVHALSNVCHVDVERISKKKPGEVLPPHEPEVVRRAVNHFLNKNEGDLAVLDVRCVPANFHARFNALERTYYYRILSGPDPLSVFENGRAWHVAEELNLKEMKKACSVLVGHHDFSSFRAAGCQANSPIRTLDELHVSEVAPSLCFGLELVRKEIELSSGSHLESCTSESESKQILVSCQNGGSSFSGGSSHLFGQRTSHRCYVITARARSFLYHQVRLMVGVLKCVGTGAITSNDVERILNAKTITAASPMAPACGLYLANVKYDLP